MNFYEKIKSVIYDAENEKVEHIKEINKIHDLYSGLLPIDEYYSVHNYYLAASSLSPAGNSKPVENYDLNLMFRNFKREKPTEFKKKEIKRSILKNWLDIGYTSGVNNENISLNDAVKFLKKKGINIIER